MQAHQRFAAEEIDFEHSAIAAVFNQEIYCALCRPLAHKFALGMIRALVGEAIAATEVTVVTDMYAQRLDLVRFDGARRRLFLEQQALLTERGYIAFNLRNFALRKVGLFCLSQLIVKVRVGFIVALVQTAAARIVYVVVTFVFKDVDHK